MATVTTRSPGLRGDDVRRQDLPYVDATLPPYNVPKDGVSSIVAALTLARVDAALYGFTVLLPGGYQYLLDADLDMGRTSFICEGWIKSTTDKTLTFSGDATRGDPIKIDIRGFWNGTNFTPGAAPQIRLLGIKNSIVNVGYAAWVQLYADGAVAVDASTAYNKLHVNATKVSIGGVSAGWCNENRFTGHITNISIGEDGDQSYLHNNNQFDIDLEGGSIALTSCFDTVIRARLEGPGNTISFSATANSNRVIQTYTSGTRLGRSEPISAVVTDLGEGNRAYLEYYDGLSIKRSQGALVTASTAAWTFLTATDYLIPVYAGDIIKFRASHDYFRPYVQTWDAAGTDNTTTASASIDLSNIDGTEGGRTTSGDVGTVSTTVNILQNGFARIRIRVGGSATPTSSICEAEIRSSKV